MLTGKTTEIRNPLVRLVVCCALPAVLISLSGCSLCQSILARHRKAPEIKVPPRTVTVTGIVKNPGLYELPEVGSLSIQQAVAKAGGMMPDMARLTAGITTSLAVDEDYQRTWSELAVTLRRGQITYVIPALLAESSEYGHIRLIDRDVVAVLPWTEAGLTGLAESNTDGSDEISVVGASLLSGKVSTVRELKSAVGVGDGVLNGTTLFNASGDRSGKIFDDGLRAPPRFARVVRRATLDGLPRVYVFPIQYAAGDDKSFNAVRQKYEPIGGDQILYLPAGTDPLVVLSEMGEERLRRTLQVVRRVSR